MKKIASLTKDVYNKISVDGKLGKELRSLLAIPKTKKMGIGDTMVRIGVYASVGDVFKYTTPDGREIFYVVINPIDENMAFCYSIYPMQKRSLNNELD